MTEPYRVFVVLDQEYGQRLSELAEKGPVWVVDTPQNRIIAQQLWAAHPNRTHLEGVTTFKFPEGSSPEDILINELDTIDEHHGTYSANPPYTIIEVIGTGISDKIKDSSARFGADQFEATAQGFRAIRPLPKDWSPESLAKNPHFTHNALLTFESPTAITHGPCVFLVLSGVWQSHGNH